MKWNTLSLVNMDRAHTFDDCFEIGIFTMESRIT